MKRAVMALVDVFSSVGLNCVLLLLLFVLTYLGTLHQVEHGLYVAQKVYFDSWWLSQPIFRDISVPLPGGLLVMSLLFVNIVVGGIVRLRFSKRRIGILVTHLGIAYLLIAGFVKFYYAEEGALQLYEGTRGSEYRSYYDWEVVITEPRPDGSRTEYLIPQGHFKGIAQDEVVTFVHAGLPFELDISGYESNVRPLPKGPMFDVDVPVVDGFFLKAEPRTVEAERNIAGCYVTVRDPTDDTTQQGILWGGSLAPWVVQVEGRPWSVGLRKKRMPIPFTVALESTARERHPGTGKPRAFMSDVTVIDAEGSQAVRIQMNEPLRHKGYVLYQSGWGPEEPGPGDRLFSVFAVVRNPADRWPLYACIVISLGLLIHFSQSLKRYMGRELGST
jgi:hypothetical protein